MFPEFPGALTLVPRCGCPTGLPAALSPRSPRPEAPVRSFLLLMIEVPESVCPRGFYLSLLSVSGNRDF